jgi:hypothetical protein
MKVNYNKQMLRELKETYFSSKALYLCIKDTADEIQHRILAENPFYDEEEKTRISRPFNAYLMSDSDFDKYLDLCYAEYKKAGIDDKRGREYCPEAESRDLYKEAEKLLVEFAIEIIPDKMSEEKQTLKEAVKMIKYRDKVLNLILSLEC